MDANGQRFWIWADEADFTRAGTATHWDRARRALTLASLRAPGTLATDRIAARARADGPAGTIDPWDTFARVTDERTRIVAGGVADGEVEIWSGSIVRDLVLAPSGVLLAAIEPAPGVRDIMFIDRRNRFAPVRLSDPAFAPDRLAAGAGGPVWALDRAARRIALIEGEPLPSLMEDQAHAPDVFRPRPRRDAAALRLPACHAAAGSRDRRDRGRRYRPRAAAALARERGCGSAGGDDQRRRPDPAACRPRRAVHARLARRGRLRGRHGGGARSDPLRAAGRRRDAA